MTSSFTTNLNLNKPANGDLVDSWDVPVNGNMNIIDSLAGGVTTFNVVGQSGVVAVTISQYQPRIWTFSGALTANVNYQIPSGIGGTWSIGNATTGAFTLTISSAGGGLSVVVPQLQRAMLSCDGTNIFLSDGIHFQDQIAQFRRTGGFVPRTTGSFVQLPLDTTVTNNITGASIASGNITLAAGTYQVSSIVPTEMASAVSTGYFAVLRLYSLTDSLSISDGAWGGANQPFSGTAIDVLALNGYFTLIGTKTLQLQGYTDAIGSGTFGSGAAGTAGFPPVYYDLILNRVS